MEKAVIFDMDGVIFDSERLFIECSKDIGQKFGKEIDDKFGLALVGKSIKITREMVVKKFGKSFPLAMFEKEVYELYRQKVESGKLKFKNGVITLLEYLKNNGYKIGLASSTPQDIVIWQLQKFQIYQYFDVIIGGNDVKNNKPDPECYLLGMAHLQIAAKNCFVIEDSFDGVMAGYASKANVIMVPDLLKPTLKISKLCKVVLNSLFEVEKYLRQNY